MNVITACIHRLFPKLEVNSAHQALKACRTIRARVSNGIRFEPYARILVGEAGRGRSRCARWWRRFVGFTDELGKPCALFAHRVDCASIRWQPAPQVALL